MSGFGPNSKIAIVTFGEKTERLLDFTDDRNAIVEKIESMTCGKGTPIPKGIKKTIELIRENPNGRHVVVFWSDGQPNDVAKSQEIGKHLALEADKVIAIGIGKSADEDLLKNYIASSPDLYYFAEAPDLSSVFNTITRLYIKS